MASKSNFGACTTEDIERVSISLTYFSLCVSKERTKPILLIFVFLYMPIRLGSHVNAGFFFSVTRLRAIAITIFFLSRSRSHSFLCTCQLVVLKEQ